MKYQENPIKLRDHLFKELLTRMFNSVQKIFGLKLSIKTTAFMLYYLQTYYYFRIKNFDFGLIMKLPPYHGTSVFVCLGTLALEAMD